MVPVYDKDAIIKWSVEKISKYGRIPLEDVRIDAHIMEEYGISSIDITSFIGELEEFVGSKLDATILFEFPTIESMAEHLSLRDGHAALFFNRIHLYLASRGQFE